MYGMVTKRGNDYQCCGKPGITRATNRSVSNFMFKFLQN